MKTSSSRGEGHDSLPQRQRNSVNTHQDNADVDDHCRSRDGEYVNVALISILFKTGGVCHGKIASICRQHSGEILGSAPRSSLDPRDGRSFDWHNLSNFGHVEHGKRKFLISKPGLFDTHMGKSRSNEKEVRGLFYRFGMIANVIIPGNKNGSVLGCAIVTFESFYSTLKTSAKMPPWTNVPGLTVLLHIVRDPCRQMDAISIMSNT